ncbi:MAG: ABC transporter substrate-binding protein, partial [Phototrophicaceae bacterium]
MRKIKCFTIIILFSLLIGMSTNAQSESIVLSVIMPDITNYNNISAETILADFEATHPNVDVIVVPPPLASFRLPAYLGSSAYFDGDQTGLGIASYVQSADVLPFSSTQLKMEATRAGYLLDLMPLVQSDPDINIDDYYTVAWNSFQWEGSFWAIPVSLSPVTWLYDANAFDEVGLPYPSENWEIDDFQDAVEALAKYNPDGTVRQAAFHSFFMDSFVRLILADSFYTINEEQTIFPNIANVEVENFINTWATLEQNNLVALGATNFDPNLAPLQVTLLPFAPSEDEGQRWEHATDIATSQVEGYAVSSGTEHPYLAYELARYLSSRPEMLLTSGIHLPANRSLSSQLEAMRYFDIYVGDHRAQLEETLENALPASDLLYSEYVASVLWDIQDGADPRIALSNEQINSERNLEIADARLEQVQNIAVVLPTSTIDEGISLNFGIHNLLSVNYQTPQWQQFVNDFVSIQPSISQLQIQSMS